ncbi:class D sortase [Terribacillus sp. DMT04]|uniref:class D sortase n=1 Tax=Terribacillus sp. DMT04 TaxID=2850441 RepID=UPI001C2C2950|nr:class D sortase [Terribacillus sp. DMT04]QXE01420.1 class D sortase [Terribacillus sp. DMT04]
MLKLTGYILLIVGIVFLSFTAYNYVQSEKESEELLAEATSMLAEGNQEGTTAQVNAEKEPRNNSDESEQDSTKTISDSLKEGDIVGVLRIPSINLEVPISEGTDPPELRASVGHVPSSGLPGQREQVFLAGHNDSTFKRAGELEDGDELVIETRSGTFTYTMSAHEIVHETETDVITPGNRESLVLMTCYPFTGIGSPTERYLIYAKPN